MKNKPATPKWNDTVDAKLMAVLAGSPEIFAFLRQAEEQYAHWDTFKYKAMPTGITAEQAWGLMQLVRNTECQQSPITSVDSEPFIFSMTNSLRQKLGYIDLNAASVIYAAKMTDAEENKFIIEGLTEEAIATSQIEGANTTNKVAREMLAARRKPKTRDEQMIINSYRVMQKLDMWKELDLCPDLLLEIQTMVTDQTLDDAGQQGRWRTDEDEIVVSDPITGDIAHIPPKSAEMQEELEKMIAFANDADAVSDDMHPVVKATILHFWIGYLHPFPDGNGRTGRALFYWYLLRKKYWMVRYLSVSRAIVESRKKYDNAFMYAEKEHDLTYFLLYVTDVLKSSVEKFLAHMQGEIARSKENEKIADRLHDLNLRQIDLLKHFLEHDRETMEVAIHQSRNGISRQTAHTDLIDLSVKGLLVRTSKRKKFVFIPNIQAIRKLLDMDD